MDIVLYLVALAATLVAGRAFGNGLDIATSALGRWARSRGGGGSDPAEPGVLDRLGTAVPASTTTTIALLSAVLASGGESTSELAGAVLAGGLALVAAVLLPLTALALHRHGRGIVGATPGVRGDCGFFLASFAVAALAGWAGPPRGVQLVVAAGLLLAFGWRVWRRLPTLPVPPHDHRLLVAPRRREPSGWLALGQSVLCLVALVACAELVLRVMESLVSASGWSVAAVAVLLAPAVTDLCGKQVAVRAARDGRADLAISTLTSALVFNGTVVVAIAMIGTRWHLAAPALAAAVIALVGAAGLLALSQARTSTYPSATDLAKEQPR